jgi:hypothetical protein
LLSKRISVPECLRLGWNSPYDIKFEPFRSVTPVLETLYAAGFEDPDIGNKSSRCRAPMFELAKRSLWPDSWSVPKVLRSMIWYFDHGAPLDLEIETCAWPHVLFFVALILNRRWNNMSRFKNQHKFIKACMAGNRPDRCVCFCSSRGCLPVFMFWRCGVSMYSHACHRVDELFGCGARLQHRQWTLSWWMRNAGMSAFHQESQYQEICRLELFERLGMAHTCCATRECQCGFGFYEDGQSWEKFAYTTTISEEERKQIQLDDYLSADHLEAILAKYRLARHALRFLPIKLFWSTWWALVDRILPPMLPEESCKGRLLFDEKYWTERFIPVVSDDAVYRRKAEVASFISDIDAAVSERRAKRERAALRNAGYEGWDFGDVIEDYFGRAMKKARRWRRLVTTACRNKWRRNRRKHGRKQSRQRAGKVVRKGWGAGGEDAWSTDSE